MSQKRPPVISGLKNACVFCKIVFDNKSLLSTTPRIENYPLTSFSTVCFPNPCCIVLNTFKCKTSPSGEPNKLSLKLFKICKCKVQAKVI